MTARPGRPRRRRIAIGCAGLLVVVAAAVVAVAVRSDALAARFVGRLIERSGADVTFDSAEFHARGIVLRGVTASAHDLRLRCDRLDLRPASLSALRELRARAVARDGCSVSGELRIELAAEGVGAPTEAVSGRPDPIVERLARHIERIDVDAVDVDVTIAERHVRGRATELRLGGAGLRDGAADVALRIDSIALDGAVVAELGDAPEVGFSGGIDMQGAGVSAEVGRAVLTGNVLSLSRVRVAVEPGDDEAAASTESAASPDGSSARAHDWLRMAERAAQRSAALRARVSMLPAPPLAVVADGVDVEGLRWPVRIGSAAVSTEGALEIDGAVGEVSFSVRPQTVGAAPGGEPDRSRFVDSVVSLHDLPLSAVSPRLAGRATVELSWPDGDATTAEVSATWAVEGGGIEHPAIAASPVDGVEATGSIDLAWERGPDAHLRADVGIDLGAVPLSLAIDLVDGDPGPMVSATLRVRESVDCAALWEAIPPSFVPNLSGASVRLEGTARAAEVRASVDLADTDSFDMRFDGFADTCSVSAIASEWDPAGLLADDWVHEVTEHVTHPQRVGRGTDQWTPIAVLPSYLPALMFLSEEIAFLDNPGFSPMLMRRGIRMSLREGRFVYGGSTMTQQLVKNLFLSRERTLSRKFEEAVLVVAMEERLSKDQILELYLNCIEFGPDVWGIRAAARHYFDVEPTGLTPLEASYLAALKPAPWWGERHRLSGRSPEAHWWNDRTHELLLRAVEYGGHIEAKEVEHFAPWVVAFPTSPAAATPPEPRRARPEGGIDQTWAQWRAAPVVDTTPD